MSVEHEVLAKRFLREILLRKLYDLEKAASVAIKQGEAAKGERQVEYWYIYLQKVDKLIEATKKELNFIEEFPSTKAPPSIQVQQVALVTTPQSLVTKEREKVSAVVPVKKLEPVKKNWLLAMLTEPIRLPFKK